MKISNLWVKRALEKWELKIYGSESKYFLFVVRMSDYAFVFMPCWWKWEATFLDFKGRRIGLCFTKLQLGFDGESERELGGKCKIDLHSNKSKERVGIWKALDHSH